MWSQGSGTLQNPPMATVEIRSFMEIHLRSRVETQTTDDKTERWEK